MSRPDRAPATGAGDVHSDSFPAQVLPAWGFGFRLRILVEKKKR